MNTALSKATARVPRGHTGEEVRSCLGRIGAFPGFSSIECYQWLAGRFLKSQRLRSLRSCEIIKTAEKREFSTAGGLIRSPTTRSDGPSSDFVSPHAIVFSNSGISSHDLTVGALIGDPPVREGCLSRRTFLSGHGTSATNSPWRRHSCLQRRDSSRRFFSLLAGKSISTRMSRRQARMPAPRWAPDFHLYGWPGGPGDSVEDAAIVRQAVSPANPAPAKS